MSRPLTCLPDGTWVRLDAIQLARVWEDKRNPADISGAQHGVFLRTAAETINLSFPSAHDATQWLAEFARQINGEIHEPTTSPGPVVPPQGNLLARSPIHRR